MKPPLENKYANVVFHHRQSGDPVAFVDPQQLANAFYDLHQRISKLEAEAAKKNGLVAGLQGSVLTIPVNIDLRIPEPAEEKPNNFKAGDRVLFKKYGVVLTVLEESKHGYFELRADDGLLWRAHTSELTKER